jgi:transcriptional regulator with XRE-family HTH domain
MKNNKPARKYKSVLTQQLLEEITPAEMEKSASKMLLAAKINDLIISKNWSKGEFAKRMGQEPSVITKWLSGTHNFTVDTICDIANQLGMTLEDLMISRKAKVINSLYAEVTLMQDRPGIQYMTPAFNGSMKSGGVNPMPVHS